MIEFILILWGAIVVFLTLGAAVLLLAFTGDGRAVFTAILVGFGVWTLGVSVIFSLIALVVLLTHRPKAGDDDIGAWVKDDWPHASTARVAPAQGTGHE